MLNSHTVGASTRIKRTVRSSSAGSLLTKPPASSQAACGANTSSATTSSVNTSEKIPNSALTSRAYSSRDWRRRASLNTGTNAALNMPPTKKS